ncbi:hypothetical protein BDF22DRAFT_776255 [Syncephalis plumigaleata]|nr:hypothetical protein BDF22DRAFT_776255 [Syncephalis plumigaleata]
MEKNGENPAWVMGNGGGTSMFEVDFKAELVPLLNRGFVAIIDIPLLNVLDVAMDKKNADNRVYIAQWGKPAESMDDYKTIRSYSPYENIKPNVAYPNILVISYSDEMDSLYWDTAKWVAKLRAATARSAKSSTDPRTIVMEVRDASDQSDLFLDQISTKLSYAIGKLGKAVKSLNSA